MRETIQNANGKQFHAVSLSGGKDSIFGNTGRSIVRWYLRRWSSASTFPVKTDLPIRWSVWRRSL